MTIFLTLPAYNEEESLPNLFTAFLAEMDKAGYQRQVVIVDDGSKDRTREVIKEWSSKLPIELVIHPQNRGLGETIRDALARAAEMANPDDLIVTMDADNTHSPALIPQMVAEIDAGKDVVIASRYCKGSKVVGLAAHRHLMSYGARVIFQMACPIPGVKDYTCGFRAYRASVVQKALAQLGPALVTERSFACMAEILLRLAKYPLKFAEVPMVLRYDLKGGASKMRVGTTTMKTLRLIARVRSES